MEIKQGFYRQTLIEYLQSEGVNRSFLHELLEHSPGHAKFRQDTPDDTKSLRLGNAFHPAVLEPERFKSEFVILPADCQKGSGSGMKSRKEAFEAQCEASNQIIITQQDYDNIQEMAGVIQGNQEAVDLLSHGEAEMSGYFTDPDYDVLCKIRLDYINKKGGIIIDLKSASDARHNLFRASAENHGYDLQAFMGLYGVTQITGEAHSDFRFIVVESKDYHGLKIYTANQEMIDTGYKKYQKAMEIYKECLEKNEWPGYDPVSELLGSPEWAKAKVQACWEI